MENIPGELLLGLLFVLAVLITRFAPGLWRWIGIGALAFAIGVPLYWLHELGRIFWAWVGQPYGYSVADIAFMIFTGICMIFFPVAFVLSLIHELFWGNYNPSRSHDDYYTYDPTDPERPEYDSRLFDRDD